MSSVGEHRTSFLALLAKRLITFSERICFCTKPSERDYGVDWSHLPDDLLVLVAKRLTTLSNLLRFSAVCQEWRRAALEGGFSPCTLPSLMFRPYGSGLPTYSVYCPFANQGFQELYPRRLVSRTVGGSLDGWLIDAHALINEGDNKKLELVNPLLGKRIQMPPLPSDIYSGHILRVALSCGGISGKDLAAMAVTSKEVLLARVGDKRWRKSFHPLDSYFIYIMYHKEQFYAVTEDGRLFAYTLTKGRGGVNCSLLGVCPFACRPFSGKLFLAESSKGELLLILDKPEGDKSHFFRVLRLEHKHNALLSWLEVESLDEDALFLSRQVSLVVSASSSRGCRRNCIYFTNYPWNSFCVYNMEKRCIVDEYPCQDIYCDSHWVWDRQI